MLHIPSLHVFEGLHSLRNERTLFDSGEPSKVMFPKEPKSSKNEMQNQKWFQKCDTGPFLVHREPFLVLRFSRGSKQEFFAEPSKVV